MPVQGPGSTHVPPVHIRILKVNAGMDVEYLVPVARAGTLTGVIDIFIPSLLFRAAAI